MGFLKKMMASVGIGAARVDTRVANPSVRVGEELKGTIVVHGGSAPQRINKISLGLKTRYKHEEGYVDHSLFFVEVVGSFDIRPGESKEFPFVLPVPDDTPLSLPGSDLWLVTDADISGAVDPGDNDVIRVLPSHQMEAVIQAAQRLGFNLKASEIESYGHRLVQQLSFNPPHGQYKLTELELAMFARPDGLDVYVEVDRRATGLASLMVSEYESKGQLFVPSHILAGGPDAVAEVLQNQIARQS